MEQKFKIGDLVTLKSGSPTMTIVDDKKGSNLSLGWVFNGNYGTAWFEGSNQKSGVFPQEALELVKK